MAVRTFAAICIGSTETEMRVYELSNRKGMHEIDALSARLSLGADAYSDRKLDLERTEQLCMILSEFKEKMEEYRVDDYRICATSALRELRSSLITRDYIEKHTGLKVQIISNSEQRFLDYKSIAGEYSAFETIISSGTAIVDIGGNSMQISVFDKDKLITTQNIRMGKVSTREKYYPVSSNNAHFEALLKELMNHELAGFGKLYQKDRLLENLLVVDTDLLEIVKNLGKRYPVERAEGEKVYSMSRTDFEALYDEVILLNPDEICERFELSADSAVLVPQSMVFCRCLMEKMESDRIWLMDVSLCDGMCYDYGVANKLLVSKHSFEEDIIAASRSIAKRYKSNMPHIRNMEELALEIFDRTKKIHGLTQREKLLLQIAVILHNCGKYISLENVSDCAYNIIMATEIIGLSDSERQVIANVVRYNNSEFVYYERMAQVSDVSREEYLIIAKLTAILRLANALDRSHLQKLAGAKVQIKDDELEIRINTSADLTLERTTLEGQADFFEEVFNIHPVIKQKRKM